MHSYLKEIKDFLLANNITFKDYNSFLDVNFKLPDKAVRVQIEVNIYNELVLKYSYFVEGGGIYSSGEYPVNACYTQDGKCKLGFNPEPGEQKLTVDFVCGLMLLTKQTVSKINALTDTLMFPF
jgi:hypothetical protein